MNLFQVYKGTQVAGPFESREGAYVECVVRVADRVVERDIAGNDLREITRMECESTLRELGYPR